MVSRRSKLYNLNGHTFKMYKIVIVFGILVYVTFKKNFYTKSELNILSMSKVVLFQIFFFKLGIDGELQVFEPMIILTVSLFLPIYHCIFKCVIKAIVMYHGNILGLIVFT